MKVFYRDSSLTLIITAVACVFHWPFIQQGKQIHKIQKLFILSGIDNLLAKNKQTCQIRDVNYQKRVFLSFYQNVYILLHWLEVLPKCSHTEGILQYCLAPINTVRTRTNQRIVHQSGGHNERHLVH
jgi:hypothetical protein